MSSLVFQICYFDRLQRQTFSHTRLFPLISSWRLEDIKKRISSESEYGFGCGALLDRIEKPVNMDISIPTHLLSEEGQSCQRQCEEEQHPQVDDPQPINEQQNHKHQAEEQEHLEPPSNLHVCTYSTNPHENEFCHVLHRLSNDKIKKLVCLAIP